MVIETLPRARTWWERAKSPWQGILFRRMILSPEDPGEQRVQLLREGILENRRRRRLSLQRARLVTEAYRETEGEHPAIRRALALRRVLERIPIQMAPQQLFVGNAASALDAVELHIEMGMPAGWESGDPTDPRASIEGLPASCHTRRPLSDEDRRLFETELWPFWKDRGRGVLAIRHLQRNHPETLDFVRYAGVCTPVIGGVLMHTIQDFRSVLEKGLIGLKVEIGQQMATIDPARPASMVDLERYNHYRAMLIVADGVIRYAERAAELADRLSVEEKDPTRAAELGEIARISRKVPAEPAETWWEALQSSHLMHMLTHLLEGSGSHCLGRFDQYMLPYLQRDLESGRLAKKRAQELLECFFLTFPEVVGNAQTTRSLGVSNNDKINISGVDTYGRDATNELSYMCLEAQAHTHLNDPNVAVRLHRQTPDDLLRCALEVIRLGGGLPILINDEAIVPALVSRCGVPLAEARNYGDIGCQENATDPNMTGADTHGQTSSGWFNLAKVVELALCNGVNPLNGKQVGPQTGDPRQFRSMDDLLAAVRQQIEYAADQITTIMAMREYTFSHYVPTVYHNLMHPGPRRTGIDMNAGGCRHNWTGTLGVGLANMGDSLAAIDHLIFREQSVTWDELLAALAANWEGHEELRRRCIEAPKYGTDNDLADAWTKRGVDTYFDVFEPYRTPKGGHYVCGLISMSGYIELGRRTGATPDGRCSQEILADCTAPSIYAPAMGPTATHRSITKAVDTYRTPNGITFNQKFNLSALLSEREVSRWADLVRTYVEAGGMQAQYTVVDRKTLLDAQKHPEQYQDLIVRVGGYSAAFVDLSQEIQDSIIARTEQEV